MSLVQIIEVLRAQMRETHRILGAAVTKYAAASFKSAMELLAENKYAYTELSASQVDWLSAYFGSFCVRPPASPFAVIEDMADWVSITFGESAQVQLSRDGATLVVSKRGIQEIIQVHSSSFKIIQEF